MDEMDEVDEVDTGFVHFVHFLQASGFHLPCPVFPGFLLMY